MLKKLLISGLLFTFSFSASALCIRVNLAASEQWPAGWEPFDPTTGTKANWNGKINGGSLNMPNSINLSSDLIQPIGTQLANGGPVPLTQFGEFVGFQPEQVLFVCSPDEEGLLYEGFIANMNSAYNGKVVNVPEVPELTFTTFVKRIGWRALHLATGQYFTDRWQLRPLTGLDRDIYGRILVKAKNFSDVQLEYYKIPTPTPFVGGGAYTAPNWTNFGYFDPFGFTALISHNTGPTASHTSRIPRCFAGQTMAECSIGSISNWYVPGTLSNIQANGGGGGFTTYKGCQVGFVTSNVTFAPISAAELEAGGSRSGQIEVIYHCENGANMGTGTGANAIGFKVTDTSKTIASSLGYTAAGGSGVTKLFSEKYNDPDSARGVAIEIFPENDPVPLNWLTSSAVGGGLPNGWSKPLGVKLNPDTDLFGIYRVKYDVKLAKFNPIVPATPGKVYATAELLLVLQ